MRVAWWLASFSHRLIYKWSEFNLQKMFQYCHLRISLRLAHRSRSVELSWIWHLTTYDSETPVALHWHYSQIHCYPKRIIPVRFPSMGKSNLDLFKNYSYSIGPCAQKGTKILRDDDTKNITMYVEKNW